ncbi:GATA-4/5/6 transcription factor [Handroanthus impetiginosus]|uniref:GATA transcription factor n=1 Tax=Handroanthus impetiginosus TaxID=429701 RepID=A0A2G9I363_9LAMI|nr:GATA-4/5/6 transcription factor [Handroanthus impetiginosus]
MEYFARDYAEFSSEDIGNFNNNNISNNNGVHFTVDDLLDFPKEDETMTDAFLDSLKGNSGDSSTVTAVDSCNSSVSGGVDGQFSGNVSCRSFNESQFSGNELCVPYDDLAELEWLSNFVEESFSTDDLRFIPTNNAAAAAKTAATDTSSSATTTHSPPTLPIFPSDVSVPGKARSKRSRAAPCDWSSRLLLLSPTSNAKTTPPPKNREPTETPGRKCLHCASEKTPQWRTGPMGPKTLCNACGVRYKSGRLVPEYRPAASPTFVSTKHSNSHRKVMELRRQKELQRQHQQHHHQQLINQASIFNGCDEFLIHHRSSINGPDLRHMI